MKKVLLSCKAKLTDLYLHSVIIAEPLVATPLMGMLPLFRPLGLQEIRVGGGGADIGPLMRDGTLGMSIQPDGEHYFDFHHTPADTVDHVDPFYLQQNAASMALMAYILAERDEPVSVHSQLISGQKQ